MHSQSHNPTIRQMPWFFCSLPRFMDIFDRELASIFAVLSRLGGSDLVAKGYATVLVVSGIERQAPVASLPGVIKLAIVTLSSRQQSFWNVVRKADRTAAQQASVRLHEPGRRSNDNGFSNQAHSLNSRPKSSPDPRFGYRNSISAT